MAEPVTTRDAHDLGHQGDVDRTVIELCLRLTPLQRLRRHEEWRTLIRRSRENAELRRAGRRAAR